MNKFPIHLPDTEIVGCIVNEWVHACTDCTDKILSFSPKNERVRVVGIS